MRAASMGPGACWQTAVVTLMKLVTDAVRQLNALSETLGTKAKENQEGLNALTGDFERAAESANLTLRQAGRAGAGTRGVFIRRTAPGPAAHSAPRAPFPA